MRIRVPRKRIRAEFNLIYETKGCQRAVNYLCKHYRVRRMRIVLNGRTGKTCVCYYEDYQAVFRKSSLNKVNVLHELCHHLIRCRNIEISERDEERKARDYTRHFLK